LELSKSTENAVNKDIISIIVLIKLNSWCMVYGEESSHKFLKWSSSMRMMRYITITPADNKGKGKLLAPQIDEVELLV
jgi:hypothetical protein